MQLKSLESPHMLYHALHYARKGLKVFPVYEPYGNVCTCGNPDCGSPGKHPRTKNGAKDATTNPDIIRAMWEQTPNANIGISTEGLVVVDIDRDKDGFLSLERLETEHGKLPDTWLSDTGGGGQHYIFRRNEAVLKNRTGILPGTDIRTDGGYIVASPSLHVSGKRYTWAPESARTLARSSLAGKTVFC